MNYRETKSSFPIGLTRWSRATAGESEHGKHGELFHGITSNPLVSVSKASFTAEGSGEAPVWDAASVLALAFPADLP